MSTLSETDTPNARTLAILDDLDAGMRPPDVARRHGVSLQWVHVIRKRAGIPVPHRPPKAPKINAPKPPKPPQPMPARTLAIIAHVEAGLLYREVPANHGVTRHHVYRLAKQHGVSRSLGNPDWRKRPDTDGPRIPRDPGTAAIERDLRAGHPYADVAARYGISRKSVWNLVASYGIRREKQPDGE